MKRKLAGFIALMIITYLIIQLTEHVTQNRIIFKKYSENTSATLKVKGNFILGYKVVLIVDGYDYKQEVGIIRFYDSAYDWYKYIETVDWASPKDLLINLSPDVFSFGKDLYLLEGANIQIGEIKVEIRLPTQSEIENYERKMSQDNKKHTTYN